MGAIHRKGHMIPSQYLEEFGKILDIQDMSAGGDLKLKQKVILTDRIVLEEDYDDDGFSFSCWLMWHGLDQCLEPEVLKSSMSERFDSSRHNALLSASLFGRLAVVRKLLREEWKPDARIIVKQGDDAGGGKSSQDEWSTVWLVFLHFFARRALQASRRQDNDEPDDNFLSLSLILEEFLGWGVKSNIRIGLGMSNRGFLSDCKVISLSELVELSKPPNLGTLRTILSTNIATKRGKLCTREGLKDYDFIQAVRISGKPPLKSPFSVRAW
jgi:hypothetical protein